MAVSAALFMVLSIAIQPAVAAPPDVADGMTAYSVLPPGQSGTVFGSQTAFTHDQVDMYAALINDDDITEAELADGTYFHDFQFGIPDDANITREYNPPGRTDVTIYRDEFGIPHIFGTDAGAGFGLGYATAEDRLANMTVLRAAAQGRLSEVLGDGYQGYDSGVRQGGYSYKEVKKIFNRFDNKFGADGKKTQALLRDFSDGVNAYVDQVNANEFPKPPEFTQFLVSPTHWQPTDTLYLAILQLRDFGGGGGDELRNAALLHELDARFPGQGYDMLLDLTNVNDPNAIPTIDPVDGTFDSQDLGPVDPDAVAIPDGISALAARRAAAAKIESDLGADYRLTHPASNFLAVAPEHSATGGSLEFGAPQVGYRIPQFFMEVDVHADSFDFRGPALPGASMLIPLGRSTDFAWSLTTGVSDAVDIRVEKLCKPIKKGKNKGKPSKKKPGADSKYYVFKGKCKKMTQRNEVIKTNLSKTESSTETLTIQRTKHGPVDDRDTVDGWPVAIVTQRFYWMKEADALPLFLDVIRNTHSVEDFQERIGNFAMSFNAVYADAEDIGYFHVGMYPKRATGVDPLLPSWGTGEWEWKGRRSFSNNPQVINPTKGWIANWNNKPAAGWDGGGFTQWGPGHRVDLLTSQMETLIAGGDVTLSDLVDVIRTAATQDGHANSVGQSMLDRVTPAAGAETEALAAVQAFVDSGGHRYDQDGDGLTDNNIVGFFDVWFDSLIADVFDDEMHDLYSYAPRGRNDGAQNSNGSAYYGDFSNYLWNLFADPAGYSRGLLRRCSDRCRRILRRHGPELVRGGRGRTDDG